MFVYKNDKRPMFDGDMSLKKMNIWVESHLKYPKILKKAGIQGRVTLSFTITKDGELTDIKVLKGVNPLFDAEAIKLLNQNSPQHRIKMLRAVCTVNQRIRLPGFQSQSRGRRHWNEQYRQ